METAVQFCQNPMMCQPSMCNSSSSCPKQPKQRGQFFRKHAETIAALSSGVLIAAGWAFEKANFEYFAVALFFIAYVVGGFVKAKEGITTLLEERALDVNLLMLVAAMGAASIGYWMEGGLLIFIFSLSGALESYSIARSQKDLTALIGMKPDTATLYANGAEFSVAIEKLRVGDTIIVKPGERIPADGIIKQGSSSINEASISGEPIPVDKEAGHEVFTGTLNGQGALIIEVTQSNENSLLARIVKLVEEAKTEMPASQQFIERFERIYANVIVVSTLVLMIAPHFLFGWSWSETFYRSMVFLVVASPCALVASIVPAMLSAISNSARKGLLVKGGTHLENLADVKVIAFDKTGTLTVGHPEVTDMYAFQGYSEQEMLQIAASIESLSEHPIAKAIVSRAKALQLTLEQPSSLQAVTGKGVEAILKNEEWRIGKPSYVGNQAYTQEAQSIIDQLAGEGKSVILMENAQGIVGILALRDTIRPQTQKTIADLKRLGIKVAMLTGDRQSTAQAIADQAGIDIVYADLLPQHKVEKVSELGKQYGKIAMVGDGVNDAPALATATVGISMGVTGSDVSLETADLVLMNDAIEKIPAAIKLSRRTKRVVKQNIVFSITVIALLILSNFLQSISLPLGVLGHEGSTILVILNGLRLLRQ
ncbi:heavy metal translocating P-type ATPase [Brevibacillus sp. SYSU BS000544]|uniref:heavy metal translocating P-type ATPase n=1 Tax=Brevibacillus sp. SYSU BS000544 TaxID=3416443 RepID=UPI003CE5ABF7